MDHNLAGLQRLHHLQIIGFDKLFPLLLGHVGGTGQAGGTVEHTVQTCILDEVLRIIGHRIGDVLQGLVDQLRLLMHQGHHQVVTACGAVTANGVDGAQLLQDAGGAHHSLEHGDVLVQTSLHLLNDLDLLCKHTLIARQHRDLFQIRHTANGTLYHFGQNALVVVVVELTAPCLLIVGSTRLQLDIVPVVGVLPLQHRFYKEVRAAVLVLGEMTPRRYRRTVCQLMVQNCFKSFFFRPHSKTLRSFFGFSG